MYFKNKNILCYFLLKINSKMFYNRNLVLNSMKNKSLFKLGFYFAFIYMI